MPAWKALLLLIIVGAVGAFGLFLFVPGSRPPIVKKWFRAAAGHAPAKTPNECLEKFKQCIKARDYETAADLYVGGEYREEMRKAAKAATALGKARDDLWHNAFEVANLNSEKAKRALSLIDPFPTDLAVKDIKHKEGEDKAYATLVIGEEDLIPRLQRSNESPTSGLNLDDRIILALVPLNFVGQVELRNEGETEKSWKVYIPIDEDRPDLRRPGVRSKVSYLKDNFGNYKQALENLSYAVKHEAETKGDFENHLANELSKAK
jgi:hypothetical protein